MRANYGPGKESDAVCPQKEIISSTHGDIQRTFRTSGVEFLGIIAAPLFHRNFTVSRTFLFPR